jgi:hypothetical protein
MYLKRRSSLVDVVLAAVAAAALSLLLWQDFDPRAIGLFAVGLGLSEFFIAMRWRLSLPCPHCGFDAVLYKRDQAAAAERVRLRLEARKQDPAAWLAPLPRLPTIIKKAEPSKKAAERAARPGPLAALEKQDKPRASGESKEPFRSQLPPPP